MVLYTEFVEARSASLDGSVRIRRRQLGVGARDGTLTRAQLTLLITPMSDVRHSRARSCG
jgi:hypothetical protein